MNTNRMLIFAIILWGSFCLQAEVTSPNTDISSIGKFLQKKKSCVIRFSFDQSIPDEVRQNIEKDIFRLCNFGKNFIEIESEIYKKNAEKSLAESKIPMGFSRFIFLPFKSKETYVLKIQHDKSSSVYMISLLNQEKKVISFGKIDSKKLMEGIAEPIRKMNPPGLQYTYWDDEVKLLERYIENRRKK